MNMKYTVEFFKHDKFLAERTVTASGKAEYEDNYYDDETYGATVEVKNAEEAHIKFWAGKIHNEKVIELNKGRGTASWESEFNFGLQVVIRPFGT